MLRPNTSCSYGTPQPLHIAAGPCKKGLPARSDALAPPTNNKRIGCDSGNHRVLPSAAATSSGWSGLKSSSALSSSACAFSPSASPSASAAATSFLSSYTRPQPAQTLPLRALSRCAFSPSASPSASAAATSFLSSYTRPQPAQTLPLRALSRCAFSPSASPPASAAATSFLSSYTSKLMPSASSSNTLTRFSEGVKC